MSRSRVIPHRISNLSVYSRNWRNPSEVLFCQLLQTAKRNGNTAAKEHPDVVVRMSGAARNHLPFCQMLQYLYRSFTDCMEQENLFRCRLAAQIVNSEFVIQSAFAGMHVGGDFAARPVTALQSGLKQGAFQLPQRLAIGHAMLGNCGP